MINIVLAADNKYIQHCITTITSILENTESVVNFYILTSGFTDISILLLDRIKSKYKCIIQTINVDESYLSNAPLPQSLKHINIVTYYRILIPNLLPNSIDKVIYLDCDIIVRKNILELWNFDLEYNALGAVYQTPLTFNDETTRLGINPKFGYFNAGVLLINLKYWREHQIMEKCIQYLKNNHESILYHDQDILNTILFNKVSPIPFKWNLMNYYFLNINHWNKCDINHIKNELLKEQKDPTLIHYVYVPKPWNKNCEHPYRNEYYSYAFKNLDNIIRPKDSIFFIIKKHIKRMYHYVFPGGYINL